MRTIKLSNVVVPPERQRETIDESYIEELAKDILEPHGLLHPIILRNDERTLVVGECRLRAVELLASRGKSITHDSMPVELGYIPFLRLGDLSYAELRKAELSENLVRRDISWQEKCKAIAELDALLAAANPEHTYAETAQHIIGGRKVALNAPTQQVKASVLLAENLHRPAVAKAKSQKEATKILSRELEEEFKAKLVEQLGVNPIESDHVLIQGDFAEVLTRDNMKGVFDCVIADPPYGINADTRFGDMAELDHEYDDDTTRALERYKALAHILFEACKPEAHAYVFLDMMHFNTIWQMFADAGWWVWKRPLIWHKGGGLLPHPHHGPRLHYEAILYTIKGRRETTGMFTDVIDIPNVKNKIHPAQKPVELYQNLIRRTCRPGDRVLDPTCGSGTIFPAATRESVYATGIELSEKAYATALLRVGE